MSEEGRKAYYTPEYVMDHAVASLASLRQEKVNESNIDHPSHYNQGKIEVIDFIEDHELNFHLGNVVKYICRKGKGKGKDKSKGSYLEDLKKAQWYLNRYILLTHSATHR